MADVTVTFGAEDQGLQRTLNMVQNELNSLRTSATSGELSVEELKQTMRQLAQLQGVEDRLRTIAGGTDQVRNSANSASDSARRAGGIFDESFARIAAAFSVGNIAAQAFERAIGLVFSGARAVVDGFRDALDLGGRLNELSTRTGAAAGSLLVLETAFRNAGVEASQVGTAINRLQSFMADASNAGSNQAAIMERLGISFTDLQNRTPIEQMRIFADRIAAIEDPTQRAATAADIFGQRLGGSLLPVLVDFSTNLEDARNKVGSLEQIMNDNAATFDAAGETIEAVQGKFAAFAAGILATTIPSLQSLGTAMEQVDAAALGEEIGNRLNPVFQNLLTVLGLTTQLIDLLGNTAVDSVQNLRQFETGNNLVNAALIALNMQLNASIGGSNQLNAVMGLLSQTSQDTANSQNSVATAVNQAGQSAAQAVPEFVNLGNTSQQTATSMSTAFQDVGGIFSDINSNIASGNTSLEQFNLTASGAQGALQGNLTLFGQQVAEIGNINTVLGATEGMLSNQNLTLGTINNGYEMWRAVTTDINAVEERKAEILQLQNQRVAAILADFQRTLQTGIDFGGLTFSNISGLAGLADETEGNLSGAKTHLDAMQQQSTPAPVVGLAEKSREARELIEDFGRYIGVDLAQMSYPDIANKLGIDTMGMTGSQQIDAIVTHINSRLNNPVDLRINTNFDPALVRAPLESPINLTINGNFDPASIRLPLEAPINMNLSGGDFVNQTRTTLSQPLSMTFTDGLGFAPALRQNLSSPLGMSLNSGGFENTVRSGLSQSLVMNLSSGGFENQVRNGLSSTTVTMSLSSGGFENQVRSGLSSSSVTVPLSSGGFESQVQSNLSSPVTMALDGSQGVAQIQQALSGPVTPQFDFQDFDRQWSQVRSTINAQATGGPGGDGGQGGQGGPGGDGGDFDPAGLTDVITAIEQVRDRLPISVLAP